MTTASRGLATKAGDTSTSDGSVPAVNSLKALDSLQMEKLKQSYVLDHHIYKDKGECGHSLLPRDLISDSSCSSDTYQPLTAQT